MGKTEKTEKTEATELRKIAKIFARGLPIEGEEWGEMVQRYLAELLAMPKLQRMYLRQAYIFASKAPSEEREDLLQEFHLTLLELKPTAERLSYTIVRQDWRDWWKRYMTRSQHTGRSLNEAVSGPDGTTCELGELLVGEAEFEYKTIERMELRELVAAMPEGILSMVKKRLSGKGLTKSERWTLDRWVNRNWQEVLV